MADLTGKELDDTYKDLLQVSNSNAGVDSILRAVEDGEGTASALKISSAAVSINGITYPTVDGTLNQAMTTDGAGTLSFATLVTTLEALTDVTITAAASGDYLRHNGTAWVDVTATQLETDLNHDNLTGFVANEHIDWTSASDNFSTSGTLDCTGTEAIKLPVGTTAQRPGTPAEGDLRVNTTLGTTEIYRSATWQDLEAGGGSGLPVADTTSIVEDPVDDTKEMRIDVGAVATATVRVLTMPDQDIDLTPGTGDFIGDATTNTLTNKTFDANGTGNSLSNVDVADLANGTDGELITWDAAGAPATVAVGTATHVLTSNGAGAAPTFQAASAGDWVLIDTATASASATVEFSTGITSTYHTFKILISDLHVATDAVELWLRFSTDGGSTFDSAGSNYEWVLLGRSTSTYATQSSAANEIQISTDSGLSLLLGTAADEQSFHEITIFDPSSTAHGTHVEYMSTYKASIAVITTTTGAGLYDQTTAVDAFQILSSSGNIATGNFRLYGLVDA